MGHLAEGWREWKEVWRGRGRQGEGERGRGRSEADSTAVEIGVMFQSEYPKYFSLESVELGVWEWEKVFT